MAFDVDAFLGEERKADEKRTTGTPPAPSMVREPRAKSDAELGIESEPIKVKPTAGGKVADVVNSRKLGTTDEARVNPSILDRERREDPIRNDPLAGAIVAGIPAAGAGTVVGAGLKALGAAEPAVAAGTGAATGATDAALQGGDPRTGALVGAALPVVPAAATKVANLAREGAAKVIEGAPARAAGRALTALTDDVKQTLQNRITEPSAQARIIKVLADPEVRAAADNPGKLLELSTNGLQTNGDAAARAYEMLDKASAKGGRPGGMEVLDVTAPLLKLRKDMVDRSEHPTAIATVDRIIDQFRSGIGRDPAARVPSADVRRFLTKQVQNPGFGRGDPLSDPPPARAALQEMSGVLKDALDGYARRHGSAEAADTLRNLNDKLTAYNLMEKSATERLARSQQAPGPFSALGRAAMGHKAEGLGGAAGYMLGGPVGSLVGAGVGHVASKLPGAVDEALSGEAAQRFARAGVPVRTFTPHEQAAIPVVSALAKRDHETAKRELARAVVGE